MEEFKKYLEAQSHGKPTDGEEEYYDEEAEYDAEEEKE